MKKFVRMYAIFAAAIMVLNFVGCSNSSGSSSAPTQTTTGGGTGTDNGEGQQTGGGNGNEQTTEPASGEYKKVDTVTINGTSYDIVTFGLWPQTIKADSVTVDTNVNEHHGAFTYCKGSDGEWYVKQAEKAYGNDYKYSDGTTTVGQGGTSEKWFKVEPIKWRVLATNYGGAKLLLAESILTGGVPYYLNTSSRTIGGATVYANNYKYSTIRAWLNGAYEADDTQDKTHAGKGFLQSAFTAAQQAAIKTTTVDNSARSTNPDANATQWNSGENQYASDTPTSDKIFLLSEKEVTASAYGFAAYDSYGAGNKRIRVTTDFAKATGAYQNSNAGLGGWWWRRSPSCYSDHSARSVYHNGDAINRSNVDYNYGGLRRLCPLRISRRPSFLRPCAFILGAVIYG